MIESRIIITFFFWEILFKLESKLGIRFMFWSLTFLDWFPLLLVLFSNIYWNKYHYYRNFPLTEKFIFFKVLHCVKRVRIQSFSGPNAGKYRPKNSEYGYFSRSVRVERKILNK